MEMMGVTIARRSCVVFVSNRQGLSVRNIVKITLKNAKSFVSAKIRTAEYSTGLSVGYFLLQAPNLGL